MFENVRPICVNVEFKGQAYCSILILSYVISTGGRRTIGLYMRNIYVLKITRPLHNLHDLSCERFTQEPLNRLAEHYA